MNATQTGLLAGSRPRPRRGLRRLRRLPDRAGARRDRAAGRPRAGRPARPERAARSGAGPVSGPPRPRLAGRRAGPAGDPPRGAAQDRRARRGPGAGHAAARAAAGRHRRGRGRGERAQGHDRGRRRRAPSTSRLELTLQYPAAVRSVIDAVRARWATSSTGSPGTGVRAMTVTVVRAARRRRRLRSRPAPVARRPGGPPMRVLLRRARPAARPRPGRGRACSGHRGRRGLGAARPRPRAARAVAGLARRAGGPDLGRRPGAAASRSGSPSSGCCCVLIGLLARRSDIALDAPPPEDHRDHLAAGAGPAGRAPGARRRGRGRRVRDRVAAPGVGGRPGLGRRRPRSCATAVAATGARSCSTSCRCTAGPRVAVPVQERKGPR